MHAGDPGSRREPPHLRGKGLILPADSVGSGPALVLLHAGVADRGLWSQHLQPLADSGHRVVAIDLPGFGEAKIPPGDQAAWIDLVETMNELGIERATLVGNSFGAAVAMRVAAVSPERVGGLALFSVEDPGAEPSAEMNALWEAEDEAIERGDVEAAIALNLDAWTLPDADPALREQLAAAQRRHLARALHSDAEHAPDPLEEDPAAIAAIGVPTLLAAGEHDMVDFRAAAEAHAAAMPDAEAVSIEGAGHLAPLETPEEFRRLLLDFLERRGL